MTSDLSQYHELYVQTASDLLDSIKKNIIAVKRNNKDSKTLEELHRNFHSLKSQSLIMGFTSLGNINQLLESLFLQIKEGNRVATNELIETIHMIVLNMEKSITEIKRNNPELNLSEDIKLLETIQ